MSINFFLEFLNSLWIKYQAAFFSYEILCHSIEIGVNMSVLNL